MQEEREREMIEQLWREREKMNERVGDNSKGRGERERQRVKGREGNTSIAKLNKYTAEIAIWI
jgi:hypothetical protein